MCIYVPNELINSVHVSRLGNLKKYFFLKNVLSFLSQYDCVGEQFEHGVSNYYVRTYTKAYVCACAYARYIGSQS